jgi:hypothetical protein
MSSTEKATRCTPISLGRVGSVSIASGWMYSKTSRRPLPSGVWRLAHGDLGVVAVEADGCVGPLFTDRVTAEDVAHLAVDLAAGRPAYDRARDLDRRRHGATQARARTRRPRRVGGGPVAGSSLRSCHPDRSRWSPQARPSPGPRIAGALVYTGAGRHTRTETCASHPFGSSGTTRLA